MDMSEGTIIAEPRFSDVIVPVATQARLDKAVAWANQCAHILNKP